MILDSKDGQYFPPVLAPNFGKKFRSVFDFRNQKSHPPHCRCHFHIHRQRFITMNIDPEAANSFF
jgi:hypothetical protein